MAGRLPSLPSLEKAKTDRPGGPSAMTGEDACLPVSALIEFRSNARVSLQKLAWCKFFVDVCELIHFIDKFLDPEMIGET
jgi:hypothetical protein